MEYHESLFISGKTSRKCEGQANNIYGKLAKVEDISVAENRGMKGECLPLEHFLLYVKYMLYVFCYMYHESF